MKQKTLLTIIFGMILLIGVVAAVESIPDSGGSSGGGSSATAGRIIPVEPWDLGDMNFIAGDTTTTTFSFDYPDVEENYNNAPLVAKIDISCLDEGEDCPLDDCSVLKGDFQFSMVATQYLFSGLLGDLIPYNTIPMTCSEQAPINFKAKDKADIQYTINEVPDGTFYCYNPNYYMMQLDSHDDITLSISSNPALYPGEYSVEVELMEMEPDNKGPVIELIKPLGDTIYSGEDIIPIELKITDMYNIDPESVRYKIVNFWFPSEGEGLFSEGDISYDSEWIYGPWNISYDGTSWTYKAEFDIANSELEQSGLYWIYAEAKDILGNEGKL